MVGITLYLWGQPLISRSGDIRLWVGSVWSSENSQQIADWYTLSHVIHGMLVVVGGRLLAPRLGFLGFLGIAGATGVAWEIVEHTEWVLGRFREATIYQGYYGDSVLNAVADYLWMLGGFALAWSVRTMWGAVIIAFLEILAAGVARDSLTLTTLSIVWPIEAVEQWQQELRPEPGGSADVD